MACKGVVEQSRSSHMVGRSGQKARLLHAGVGTASRVRPCPTSAAPVRPDGERKTALSRCVARGFGRVKQRGATLVAATILESRLRPGRSAARRDARAPTRTFAHRPEPSGTARIGCGRHTPAGDETQASLPPLASASFCRAGKPAPVDAESRPVFE
ncbi:hypothetical protein SAMN05216551_101240 [Chitinasiproducens palmae]|uniref:Uncharacterized protein n=1 Tax=Chitinasiproducens palmae TaxID=1770053 RepID=A0A1H2PK72_9BURK|nr:hypothetical protein SAMN05216551_101240 [Chitinasiproducens palmae]